jgi:hypothetical protein
MFTEHAAVTLRIDLPETYSPEEVVAEIQQRLRALYPLATITVEDGRADDQLPTWHVHRDGYPELDQPIS